MCPARSLRGGAALALLTALAAFGADESAPVPRPDVKVGDTWVYQFTNFAAQVAKPARAETRATFVSADAIVTVNRVDNGPETDSHFTAEWNQMASPGWLFDPNLGHYKFPMKVGDSYPYAFEGTRRGGPERTKAEGTFKVVGWEDVVVPAGKFRALKLEGRGSYRRLDTVYSAPQRWDIWYVPEVRRGVRQTYEDGPPGANPDTKTLFELMEFKLQ